MPLGWIDFSKDERNKVLNVIHLLDGKLSTMSTIKRKNRHLLAIPIYLNLDI